MISTTARPARLPSACPAAKPIDLRRNTHTAAALVSTQADVGNIETHTLYHSNQECLKCLSPNVYKPIGDKVSLIAQHYFTNLFNAHPLLSEEMAW
eukprot:sb/3479183/